MHCNTPAAPGRAAKISSFIHVQATFKGNPASSSKGDQAKKNGLEDPPTQLYPERPDYSQPNEPEQYRWCTAKQRAAALGRLRARIAPAFNLILLRRQPWASSPASAF